MSTIQGFDCSGNWGLWTGWTDWTPCNVTCDGINTTTKGQRSRVSTILKYKSNKDGTCTPFVNTTQIETDYTCQKTDCPVDCVNNYDNWDECIPTVSCDRMQPFTPGIQTRKLISQTPAAYGGKSCPPVYLSQSCNKKDCPVDCSWNWNSWNNWSDCNAIAGERTITGAIGQITRTIKITINPLNNGRTCPVPQIQNCTIPPPITNISPPNISEGDITTDNSTDKFMIFKTGTSSFIVRPGGVVCDILMIGGGGAGGQSGGGGGAGACIVAIGHTLPGGVCNVTVGSGGFGMGTGTSTSNVVVGTGGDSLISVSGTTLYRAKGGGGGARLNNNGNSGGCGGGAGVGIGSTRSGGDVSTNIVNTANGVINTSQTIQPTYAVLGNTGGEQLDKTFNNSAYSCPGGGGIGATGGSHASGFLTAGPGGNGLNKVTINGITYNFKKYFANNLDFGINYPQFVDISGYIGGGGSGMTGYNSNQALGGVGGGGMGAANIMGSTKIVATPGAANTGSGGGGGHSYGGDSSGGSGIVIIRYRS